MPPRPPHEKGPNDNLEFSREVSGWEAPVAEHVCESMAQRRVFGETRVRGFQVRGAGRSPSWHTNTVDLCYMYGALP